jgi:hypothetical protein
MAGDVGRVEVEAHRQEAVLAGQLQRFRTGADAGDPDRRVGLLERLDVRTQALQHRPGLRDVPVFAGVVEGFVLGPQLQDDVERLAGHLTVLPGIAVDIEQCPIAGQPTGGDAEIEPALRHVVEHRYAVGELGGVVIGQEETARSEADAAGLHQRLRDQQIGRRVRLPRRGVMLADPRLAEAEFVSPTKGLQVPAMAVVKAALGRMRRHREQAIVHRASPCSCCGRAATQQIHLKANESALLKLNSVTWCNRL